MRFKIIVFIVFVSLSSFVGLHKYYVSVTEVTFASKEESIQITSRLFIDDFEVVLQERYDENFHLEDEKTTNKRSVYIQKYYNQKLLISVNNKLKTAKYIGSKFEDDMLVSYFEILGIKAIRHFEITNKLLLENGNNQQNITHVNINNKKKSYLFVKGKEAEVLKF